MVQVEEMVAIEALVMVAVIGTAVEEEIVWLWWLWLVIKVWMSG